jgi:hypothetical protein
MLKNWSLKPSVVVVLIILLKAFEGGRGFFDFSGSYEAADSFLNLLSLLGTLSFLKYLSSILFCLSDIF